ncbi:unnamed protein product, partial [Prorocentrum cordatum]
PARAEALAHDGAPGAPPRGAAPGDRKEFEAVREELTVNVQKGSQEEQLGLEIFEHRAVLGVKRVLPDGAAAGWNAANPGRQIQSGDFVVSVNGLRGCSAALLHEIQAQRSLEIVLHRAAHVQTSQAPAGAGTPLCTPTSAGASPQELPSTRPREPPRPATPPRRAAAAGGALQRPSSLRACQDQRQPAAQHRRRPSPPTRGRKRRSARRWRASCRGASTCPLRRRAAPPLAAREGRAWPTRQGGVHGMILQFEPLSMPGESQFIAWLVFFVCSATGRHRL